MNKTETAYTISQGNFSMGVLLYPRYPLPDFIGPALREMGVDFVAAHFTLDPDLSAAAVSERVSKFSKFCESEKLNFRILVAYSEFPDTVFRVAAKSPYFEGVQLQEAPWGKIIRGDSKKNPRIKPFAELNPEMTPVKALDSIEKGIKREVIRYRNLGCSVSANTVFPVMYHPLAKEGITISAKLMKESFSPLAHANAWGAAIQYNQDLWADADLWFHGGSRLGHSAAELKSNLLFAYWTGVSRFMVEGAGGKAQEGSKAPTFRLGETGKNMTFFSRQGGPYFFFPLNGALFFDHRVTYRNIKDIPLIFLTGIHISGETLAAVEKAVAKGSVCVSSPNLLPSDLKVKDGYDNTPAEVKHGEGIWIITRDFSEKKLTTMLGNLLGKPDEISYRFEGNRKIIFHKAKNDSNRVDIDIIY